MTRVRILLVAMAAVLAAAWPAAPRSAIEDLMMDLRVIPVDPVKPPSLNVTTVDGVRMTLADVRGHVVLVYFWATW
jgi:cytochrome oxidase Cu insertion factor (SCO1/SenC/PrrC family)